MRKKERKACNSTEAAQSGSIGNYLFLITRNGFKFSISSERESK